MSDLQIGDTIECHDKNDLIDTMEILQKEGHEQWLKLDKEYDRLSELRFGKAGANER